MVVSQGNRASAGARWTWVGSTALQGCAAALLIMFPLLHPVRILLTESAPRAIVPLSPAKPHEVKVKRVEASLSTARAAVEVASGPRAMAAPAVIPRGIQAGDPPPTSVTGFMQGSETGLPAEFATGLPATRVGVAVAVPHGPLRVSSGVGAGLLVTPIRPVYPSIARAARVEGTVVVSAVISRDGRMERARVLSGPAMLAGAALEAVETARYTPYRLNGEATEVETTITVNFRLGG